MTTTKEAVYDEKAIRSLKSLEHIRLRPGMYIGRMGTGAHPDDGIYILLKEVIDNGIDEFIMGHGRKLIINIEDEQRVSVRDFGRGIPLGKVLECVSQINTGAKFNDDVFQFSVGLNGVGTKAVNALSEYFRVTSFRDGKYRRVTFRDGVVQEDKKGNAPDEPNGTLVEFIPSHELFGRYHYREKFVIRRLWNYAYLNSGLSLIYNGQRIFSRNGLYDMLEEKVDGEKLYEIIHHRENHLEFALVHTSEFGENFFSFVNGQYTSDGGTHQSAFREAILKAVNAYSGKSFEGSDVRNGIFGAISIKLKDPIFESQTKNKLGNAEIRSDLVNRIKDILEKFLHQNPQTAEIILEKVNSNAQVRKQVASIRKASREKAKKIAIKIPKLKDCKYHLGDKSPHGDNSMIFIAEGDSAVGPMISARDPLTQAIFPLKGKPLNTFGKKQDIILHNDELYCLVRALNIEDGLEGLRYSKVIIATDADDDGMHIRNLLLTFFLHFYRDLILKDHLYILETPLFRVRNNKTTIYCYDEEERDEAVAKLGKSAEVTRFKGLGEIDPREFGQFIGEDMRIVPVEIEKLQEIPELLKFFMGPNTPERREFIMEHLVIADEV
ncbi:MAG: type IIA DNA topoisomerase subunit B [Lentisphaerae bacterium]|nr:MAG: type IIA DNA topoisomerase subunit B [Lentisphaerota bacterium]